MWVAKHPLVTFPGRLFVSVVSAVPASLTLRQLLLQLLGCVQEETWQLVFPQVQNAKKPQ